MTSIGGYVKQIPNDARFFTPISSLAYQGAINALNRTTGALTQATWLRRAGTDGTPAGDGNGTTFLSSVNGPGAGRLRDLGKTYVSAGREFRKVQLVWYAASSASTFGVNGASGTAPDQDYLTGYIELGWEGAGAPAPVARMGP
jgi:hypothetical protein